MERSFWEHLWFKIKGILTSRKFWAAVGVTIGIVASGMPLEEALNAIAAIWIAFIVGTGVEDGLKGMKS